MPLLSPTVRRSCRSKEAFLVTARLSLKQLWPITLVYTQCEIHTSRVSESWMSDMLMWLSAAPSAWPTGQFSTLYWTRRHFILTLLPYRRACLKKQTNNNNKKAKLKIRSWISSLSTVRVFNNILFTLISQQGRALCALGRHNSEEALNHPGQRASDISWLVSFSSSEPITSHFLFFTLSPSKTVIQQREHNFLKNDIHVPASQ